jgi:tryptophan 7-halogenase
MAPRIESVLVLGGGSAGFIAALSVKKHLPALRVRVVRSPDIGIIGVGEGSTADLPNHFHGFLGLDPKKFYAEVRPTPKLGVHFLWGPRASFDYTFTPQSSPQVAGLPRSNGYYMWEDPGNADVHTALMAQGKAYARQLNGSPDVQRTVAYHVENAALVSYLEREARDAGVEITDATVRDVEKRDAEHVSALVLDSGEKLAADLFIDASGFRCELLGRALAEPFISYADTLFCDRAIAGGWERTDEPLFAYTTAETMDAGWAWQIEHERHVNRGYVYSSAFLSDGEADAEFRRKNPRVQKTRVVKFRTGRHVRAWVGNVFAIGNAHGFVEPLEATALLIICHAARYLAGALVSTDCAPTPSLRESGNRILTRLWDEIRDFLAIHYRFNTRLDTPFWQACRHDVALHGAERIVQNYQENGPSTFAALDVLNPASSIFQLDGFHTLLLGQRVPHERTAPRPAPELARWREHTAKQAAIARNGFTAAEALQFFHHPGWQWMPGFYRV